MTYSNKLRRSSPLIAAIAMNLACLLVCEAEQERAAYCSIKRSEKSKWDIPEADFSNESISENATLSEGKANEQNTHYYRGTQLNFIGNIESMKFHRTECEFARAMAKHRQMGFEQKEKAIQAGMTPCNWCFPSWSKAVAGRLITPIQATGTREINSASQSTAAPNLPPYMVANQEASPAD